VAYMPRRTGRSCSASAARESALDGYAHKIVIGRLTGRHLPRQFHKPSAEQAAATLTIALLSYWFMQKTKAM
jgi:hypothetical protein